MKKSKITVILAALLLLLLTACSGDDNNNDDSNPFSGTSPDAPTLLSVSGVTFDSITITWSDSAITETGYYIYWSTVNSQPATESADLAADTETYQLTGLTDGTTYYIWVEAYNSDGQSDAAMVSTSTAAVGAPDAPTALTAGNITKNSMELAWTDNATNETGYAIYYATGSTKPGSAQLTAAADSTNIAVSGLTDNTLYYFWVQATNASGASTEATVTNTTLEDIYMIFGEGALANFWFEYAANNSDHAAASFTSDGLVTDGAPYADGTNHYKATFDDDEIYGYGAGTKIYLKGQFGVSDIDITGYNNLVFSIKGGTNANAAGTANRYDFAVVDSAANRYDHAGPDASGNYQTITIPLSTVTNLDFMYVYVQVNDTPVGASGVDDCPVFIDKMYLSK